MLVLVLLVSCSPAEVEDQAVVADEETEPASEEIVEEETATEELIEEEEASQKDFEVNDVETVILGRGTENEKGMIQKVSFSLVPENEINNLRVYVYAFDDKSLNAKNTMRGVYTLYETLEPGKEHSGEILLSTGTFSDLSLEKTVRVKFYDASALLHTEDVKVMIE